MPSPRTCHSVSVDENHRDRIHVCCVRSVREQRKINEQSFTYARPLGSASDRENLNGCFRKKKEKKSKTDELSNARLLIPANGQQYPIGGVPCHSVPAKWKIANRPRRLDLR